SRSRDRGPASTRAPGASSRAFAGAPRRAPASRSCDLPFARNSSENPVHEPARLLCRIALGECDSFVDCHLERHTSFVELVGREAKDVPLDSAEPIGRPAFGGSGDPIVEIDHPGGYGLGCFPRKLVDLAFIERRERLAGHVPLVEQEERGPAGGSAAERHTSSSTTTSTLLTSTPHIRASASATCR